MNNLVLWLGRLAAVFGSWTGSLRGTANGIRGVPILGPYLAGAYDFAADRMADAFVYTVQTQFSAAQLVGNVQNTINTLLSFDPIRPWVTSLRNFIQDPAGSVVGWIGQRVGHWTQFWSDPVGWVWTRLTGLGATINQWRFDPAGWVRDRLTGLASHVSQFLSDPTGWLRGRLPLLAAHITQFLSDPLGWVKARILLLIPSATSFLNDPGGWVRDRLISATGLTVAFFSDPFGWVRDRIFAAYPDLRTITLDPKFFIVDKFVEGLETLLEAYKTRLLKVFERAVSSLF